MSASTVKAYLNLHAVLQNLEELVMYDPRAAAITKKWNVSIQFFVPNGPAAVIHFRKGACTVEPRLKVNSDIFLACLSNEHLNKVMDNRGQPILVRGFTKLPFLLKQFPQLTKRLEEVLKPTPEALKDHDFLALHTRLMLQTAAYATAVLSRYDEKSRLAASRIQDGTVSLEVEPDGPSVFLTARKGVLSASKGKVASPMARMSMKSIETAQKFLSGVADPFTAIALGDVRISGQTGMLDSLSLILDQVSVYLS